uniref:Gag-like protein n=1 Tax=Timema shepardi TaxID=629360 RepID=A0A7R9G1G6_TIMSH|nr:unnamed protein product [Timema shepardi]
MQVHVAMAEAGPLEWACSLYISPTSPGFSPRPQLESLIQSLQPAGLWQITETGCGYIVSFASDSDAQNFLSIDLVAALDGSVQVAKFNTHDTRYKQIVLLRDVPWAIPLQDISEALTKQGISSGILERSRQHVRVEVLEPSDYECLLQQGLNFFGAIQFTAIPERCWKVGVPPCGTSNATTICNTDNTQQDSVLQCYRCQGFWHIAANCRHLPRCVRCGEPHSVEFCPRPRNDPVCCHCGGPHHAAYKHCPVRQQLINATPITISLSSSRNPSNKQQWASI